MVGTFLTKRGREDFVSLSETDIDELMVMFQAERIIFG